MLDIQNRALAARYNTWLLIRLTPKGVVFAVFSFLFTSFLRFSLTGTMLCHTMVSGL